MQIRLLGVCRGDVPMSRIVLLSLFLAGCSKEPARFTLVAASQTNLVYRLDTKTGEVIGLTWGKAFPIRNLVWDKKSGTYRLDPFEGWSLKDFQPPDQEGRDEKKK